MAVTFVRQVPFSEQTEQTLAPDGTPYYTETQTWQVGCDVTADLTTTTAQQVLGLPKVGDPHPLYPTTMRCKSVRSKRSDEAPTLFDITVVYGTVPTAAKWYTQISVSGVERQEEVNQDANGKALVNSAGDPFDPTVPEVFYDEEIRVRFNTSTIDFDGVSTSRGRINTDTVTMTVNGVARQFPPKTLKLQSIDYDSVVKDGLRYFSVNLVLHYRQLETDPNTGDQTGGWTTRVVDRGFHYLDASGNKQLILVKDPTGGPDIPAATPQLLDGSGGVLSAGNPCKLLPFQMRPTANFTTLLEGIAS